MIYLPKYSMLLLILGDATLIVFGARIKSINHAEMICDLSFDRRDVIDMLEDPSTGKEVHIRKGIHSGIHFFEGQIEF